MTESLTSKQRCDSVVRSQLLIKRYTQILLTIMIDHSAIQWQMDLLRGLALGDTIPCKQLFLSNPELSFPTLEGAI